MDPSSGTTGPGYLFGTIGSLTPPEALWSGDLADYVHTLDEHSQALLRAHSGKFSSREEAERFLEHQKASGESGKL